MRVDRYNPTDIAAKVANLHPLDPAASALVVVSIIKTSEHRAAPRIERVVINDP